MAITQTDYRWGNDDGSESAATFLAAVNTTVEIDESGGDVNQTLRIAMFETGENTISTGQLEFSVDGGAWTNLTTTSTPVKAFNSSNLTDANDCTQRINSTTFESTNEGVIETGSGGIVEFNNSGVEHLYTITFIAASLSGGESIDFRVTDPTVYTNTANATIKSAAGANLDRTLLSSISLSDIEDRNLILSRAVVSALDTADLQVRNIILNRILNSNFNVSDLITRSTIGIAPKITASSVTTKNGSGNFTMPISAAQSGRVVLIVNLSKDSSTTVNVISTLKFDTAGVNATLAGGEIILQGTTQIAQEGDFSSQCGAYLIKDADLPTSAGTYTIEPVFDGTMQSTQLVALEILGCPDEAYDAIIQNSSVVDVSGATKFSDSITPTVDDCLIIDFWATSHNAAPTFTSTETQVASISNTNAGAVCSQFTQTTAAAKTMEQESSTLHQRRAYTLLSFSGIASAGAVLSRTLTSSINISDIEERALNMSRSLLSNIDVSDQLIAESLFNRILSSGVDISDLVSYVTNVINARVLSSTIAINDTLLADKKLSRLVSSSIDLTDSQIRQVILSRLLVSGFDVNDILSSIVSGVGLVSRVLSSSIGINDLTTSNKILSRLLASELSITSVVNRQLILDRVLFNDVTILDNISSLITSLNLVNRVLSSNIDISDLTERYMLMSHGLQSNVDISDSQIAYLMLTRTLSDVFYLSDSVIQALAETGVLVITRNLSDAVTISDSVIRNLLITRLLSENIALNDSVLQTIVGDFVELILTGIEIKGIEVSDEIRNIQISDEIKKILVDSRKL